MVCNLFVLVAIVVHHKRLYVGAVNGVNHLKDVLMGEFALCPICLVCLLRIQEVGVLCFIHKGVLVLLAAVVVDEGVLHDGVQPALDVGALLKLFLIAYGLQAGVLNQVFSIIQRFGKLQCELLLERALRNDHGGEFVL